MLVRRVTRPSCLAPSLVRPGWIYIQEASILKNILQPVNNALKKRGDAQSVVVIKKYENGKDDYGDNNKPFKHVGQQKEPAWYGQQQHPTDVKRIEFIVFVNIIQDGVCAAFVLVPGI